MQNDAFVSPEQIRARFSQALSAMYQAEVPLYGELLELVGTLNRVMIDMVGASAEVSSTRNQVTGDSVLAQGLQGATELGVSRLVDTELNEQSVRLTAEKVQDQLQASSLNMANVSMTSWLRL